MNYMRAVTKRPGMKGLAESMDGCYALPDSMPDPCEVVVVECPEGSPWVVVRDAHGRRWVIEHWLVDCGYEYRRGGRYVHESNPALLDELHRELAKGWDHVADSTTKPWWVAAMTKTIRKVLLRNGRNPDAPPPVVRRMRT